MQCLLLLSRCNARAHLLSTFKDWHGYCFCFLAQDKKGIVQADLCLCKQNSKEPPPKIYEVKDSNCISCPLGHTWVGRQQPSDCTSGSPLRVSVGRLFFSNIAVQLLTSKLLCFSTRINSWAVDIPYSSKDMPKVICSTRWVLQYLYELEYCTIAVVWFENPLFFSYILEWNL
jgi:hypothetical protein